MRRWTLGGWAPGKVLDSRTAPRTPAPSAGGTRKPNPSWRGGSGRATEGTGWGGKRAVLGVSLDFAPGIRVDASPLGGWLTSGLTGQARGSTARRRQVNKINRPNCGRPILAGRRSPPCFLVEGVPRPQGREWILRRHEHSPHHTHRGPPPGSRTLGAPHGHRGASSANPTCGGGEAPGAGGSYTRRRSKRESIGRGPRGVEGGAGSWDRTKYK